MVSPPGGGDWSQYDWHWDWARVEWKEETPKKTAEALAQANDVGRNNFGALETRLMALQEKVDAHDAFYKRKLEKQESDHQDVMALADERLKQLEQINLQ